MESRGEVPEDHQPWIRRPLGTAAGHQVAIPAAGRAQSPAVLAAERLHGQGQRGLAGHEGGEVDLAPVGEVEVEVVAAELDTVALWGPGDVAHVHVEAGADRELLEAPAADDRHRRIDLAGD